MTTSTYSFGGISKIVAGSLLISVSISYIADKIKAYRLKNKKKADNVIVLIQKNDERINETTQLNFLKQVKKLDDNKDVNIIIQTNGGVLCNSEAICQYIFNLKNDKRKIRCYVPNFAFSGGCLIALCCDEIVITKNSFLSPCDAQFAMDFSGRRYALESVVKTVNYKQLKNEKIDENWLASYYECQLVMIRQKEFLDKIVVECKYDEETKTKIYDELFSGKHNHDRLFSAVEMQKMSKRVIISDKMPDFVTSFMPDNDNDKD